MLLVNIPCTQGACTASLNAIEAPGSSADSGLWSHCPVGEGAEVIVCFPYLLLSHCLGWKVKLRPGSWAGFLGSGDCWEQLSDGEARNPP